MIRIGAALDLRFGKDTLQFIDFLYSNGFNHIEVRKENDHVYGAVDPALLGRILSLYDFTISYHAPSREFNLASVNERIRSSCVSQIIEIGGYLQEVGPKAWVNIHAGHVPQAYHENVIAKAEENMTKSVSASNQRVTWRSISIILASPIGYYLFYLSDPSIPDSAQPPQY